MSAEGSSSSSLAFDPALPLPWLTAICVVLAGVCLVFFCLERKRATHPRVAWGLLPFRFLAIAGVWLALANPSAIRSTISITHRTSVLCLDTSASMNIRDPAAGSLNLARWQQAGGEGESPSADLDEAVALLSGAKANVSQVEAAFGLVSIVARLESVQGAVEKAIVKIQASRAQLAGGAQIDPILAALEAEVKQPLEHLRQLAAPSSDTREGLRAPLHSLAARLGEVREQVRAVADGLPGLPGGGDNATGPSRMKLLKQWLSRGEGGWLGNLASDTRFLKMQFAKAVAPAADKLAELAAEDPKNTSASTDLQAAVDYLGRLAADDRLDLAVLATDGGHNASEQPVHLPGSLLRVPLIVVPVGDFQPRRDINLRWMEAPKTLLVTDQLTIQARVTATLCEGESSVVELLQGDNVLDTKEVHFDSKQVDRFVELKWTPGKVGVYDLLVRARPVSGEVSLRNNERPLRVSVVDDRIDLLVVDGSPRWETRYLSNLFRREAQSHVTTMLFSPVHAFPGRTVPPQPALPLGLDAWQRFQVVILGDLNPVELTPAHQRVLKTYVERGGCLIIIAGTEWMPARFAQSPLAELLPVVPEVGRLEPAGYGVRLTPEGLASDSLRISGEPDVDESVTWSSIYQALPMYDVSAWSKPKPGARVLIEAVPNPPSADPARVFLATQKFGSGTVAYLSSPSTYSLRWRFGDRLHYQFWGQFVRALVADQFGAGTPRVRLVTDRFGFTTDEPVRVRLRLRAGDGSPVTNISGEIAAYQSEKSVGRVALVPDLHVPGDYEATLESLPEGRIDLRPEGADITSLLNASGDESPHAEVDVQAGSASLEMLPPAEPPAFFQLIRNSPNAMLVAPATLPTLLPYIDLSPTSTESIQRTPLWDRWALLLAIVGLLVIEWIGRKICGLV